MLITLCGGLTCLFLPQGTWWLFSASRTEILLIYSFSAHASFSRSRAFPFRSLSSQLASPTSKSFSISQFLPFSGLLLSSLASDLGDHLPKDNQCLFFPGNHTRKALFYFHFHPIAVNIVGRSTGKDRRTGQLQPDCSVTIDSPN
jgi:hypothetical protein